MKLHIINGRDGDCLLLQSQDGKNILCDGGRKISMEEHGRAALQELIGQDGLLDLIYVSHIDDDHISGIIRLMDDMVDWKVHDHHTAAGETGLRAPKFPKPPNVGAIWHNSFSDQLQENAGPIGDMLAHSAPSFLAAQTHKSRHIGTHMIDIATSIPNALKLSALAEANLMDIPINKVPGQQGAAKLITREAHQAPIPLGSLNISVVGPTEQELDLLRQGWNNWLEDSDASKKHLERLKKKIQEQLDRFATGQTSHTPFDLRDWNGIEAIEDVSIPNVSSLVLMVEEDGKRLLLTGDAQHDMMLDQLTDAGFMTNGEFCHLDVLKVPHHGSEHNVDENFARRVSADHYVFCGNGNHGNPEPEVIRDFYESRMGSPEQRALAPEAADRPFTFWFSNMLEAQPGDHEYKVKSRERRKMLDDYVADSGGLLTLKFLEDHYMTLEI